jgi:hypothetical protein
MLVNTIESECHIVVAVAVSIENMKSGGTANRLLCLSQTLGGTALLYRRQTDTAP